MFGFKKHDVRIPVPAELRYYVKLGRRETLTFRHGLFVDPDKVNLFAIEVYAVQEGIGVNLIVSGQPIFLGMNPWSDNK